MRGDWRYGEDAGRKEGRKDRSGRRQTGKSLGKAGKWKGVEGNALVNGEWKRERRKDVFRKAEGRG